MEFSYRACLLIGSALILSLSVQLSAGATQVTGKQLSNTYGADGSTERGGWGYPTGYSYNSGLAGLGLPLVIIPLIYFGVLWCVLLFGLAAFHAPHSHAPHHHRSQHHRNRRYDDAFEDDYSTQQHIMSSI